MPQIKNKNFTHTNTHTLSKLLSGGCKAVAEIAFSVDLTFFFFVCKSVCVRLCMCVCKGEAESWG